MELKEQISKLLDEKFNPISKSLDNCHQLLKDINVELGITEKIMGRIENKTNKIEEKLNYERLF